MRSRLVQKFSGTLPWGLIQSLFPLFPETIFCHVRWEPTGWAGSCCSEEQERSAGLVQPPPPHLEALAAGQPWAQHYLQGFQGTRTPKQHPQ